LRAFHFNEIFKPKCFIKRKLCLCLCQRYLHWCSNWIWTAYSKKKAKMFFFINKIVININITNGLHWTINRNVSDDLVWDMTTELEWKDIFLDSTELILAKKFYRNFRNKINAKLPNKNLKWRKLNIYTGVGTGL